MPLIYPFFIVPFQQVKVT